jgi:hypothetical protein
MSKLLLHCPFLNHYHICTPTSAISTSLTKRGWSFHCCITADDECLLIHTTNTTNHFQLLHTWEWKSCINYTRAFLTLFSLIFLSTNDDDEHILHERTYNFPYDAFILYHNEFLSNHNPTHTTVGVPSAMTTLK